MKKKGSGGKRQGAGRPPLNKKVGARAKTGITMPPHFYAALKKMSPALRGAVIDTGLAIAIPAHLQDDGTPGTRECLIVYNAISEAIQALERARDYGGEDFETTHLTPAQVSLHALLSRVWDEIRDQELFTEPEF